MCKVTPKERCTTHSHGEKEKNKQKKEIERERERERGREGERERERIHQPTGAEHVPQRAFRHLRPGASANPSSLSEKR